MFGDAGSLGPSSDFIRQFGELKARPLVLTPLESGVPGAIDHQWLEIRELMVSARERSPKAMSYTLCCCGMGLSGASTIVM